MPESVQALIAARLDTLAPERKSLLQDAAVVGKVFWAGALAEMGGRDLREVEQALHELARKELVRPARTSSMDGEAEYGFWHVLVRDVCYGQIPRAARAARHRGGRSVDGARRPASGSTTWPTCSPTTTCRRSSSPRRSATPRRRSGLPLPARRFLALAGERALGLDAGQAEARLARALELCPAGDPERPELLLGWAEAAVQVGRVREAADALEEALAVFRDVGAGEAEARVLILLARVTFVLGEGRQVALSSAAVDLLEQGPPGETLVAAYAQLANAYYLTGAHSEAMVSADQAIALAERLGLPEPTRALVARGMVRAELGDSEGLAEMERALALLIEQGAGHDAANLQNNLAIASYPLEGPARSLATFEQGIAFCKQRGLAGMAAQLEDEASACSSSSAAPRRRSSGPVGSSISTKRPASRTRSSGCALSSSKPDSLVESTRPPPNSSTGSSIRRARSRPPM